MAAWLLALGLPLIFFMPFIGIPMFLAGWWLAVHEDKEEASTKKKQKELNDAHWHYHHNKWTNPTSQKVVAAAKVDNRNHQEFLKRQVARIEKEYRNKGIYPYFPQIASIYSDNDRIDDMFATPEKYINVSKSIEEEPIRELVEDWRAQIQSDRNAEAERDNQKKQAEEKNREELLNIKADILVKAELGFTRREIVNQVKAENSVHKDLVISRENNVWRLELNGDVIRFEAPTS